MSVVSERTALVIGIPYLDSKEATVMSIWKVLALRDCEVVEVISRSELRHVVLYWFQLLLGY
jgi:hypothetical protein